MKKIKYIILTLSLCLLTKFNVYAAGTASFSVNKSTVENGGTVTASVTIRNSAAWNIKISSSGSTSGCSQNFADATSDGNNTTKTFSVTCKATSTGIINFQMSGDITSSDGANVKISGNKQVTVVKPREKSTNNKLKSLSVEGYEITPEFNKDVYEYSVTVPSTVETIKIDATKEDSYASIEGIGEKTVEEGINTFEIIVTSETGVSNVYKLTVDVEDTNPIEVEVDGKKYTVVKVSKNLEKPEFYDETIIKIQDYDIPAFKNDTTNYTLVGLKDTEGNISLFIYEDGLYTKYNEFTSNRIIVNFLKLDNSLDLPKKTIKIDNFNVEAYEYNKNTVLVYALNIENGEKNYYTYNIDEKTIQIFDINKYKEELDEETNKKYLILSESIVILFLLLLLILYSSKTHKLKKLIKNKYVIKEEKNNIKEDIKDEEKKEIENKEVKKKNKKTKKEEKEEVTLEEDIIEENIIEEKPKKKRKKETGERKIKDIDL